MLVCTRMLSASLENEVLHFDTMVLDKEKNEGRFMDRNKEEGQWHRCYGLTFLTEGIGFLTLRVRKLQFKNLPQSIG